MTEATSDAEQFPGIDKAPRVTEDRLEEVIRNEEYHLFKGSTLTICVLTLQNGYHVTGESACASPENFNAEYGRKLARKDAKRKIWELEGYALREALYVGEQNVMRAKMEVESVEKHYGTAGEKKEWPTQTDLVLRAVTTDPGSTEGDCYNEDNTYSKYTPAADLHITITNPKLVNKFFKGQRFYLDFSEAK